MERASDADSSFHFVCQRSGRCCRVPDGYAFVDESELAGLAAELGLALDQFTRRYLRSVIDPNTAEPRLSLRDRPDGACSLLDGDNQCLAYAKRPAGCAEFPLWASVLEDAKGLRRAMDVCPGIEQRPVGAARAAALAKLQELLETARSAQACSFPAAEFPGGPQVSGLEAELLGDGLLELGPEGCPHEDAKSGTCGAGSRAPLACRLRGGDLGLGLDGQDADSKVEALFAARDQLEASLPWPRRAGSLQGLLRARFDPAVIDLVPKT